MVKRVTVLAVVFVVLFCIVWFADIAPERRRQREQVAKIYSGRMFKLQNAFPSRVELTTEGGSVFEFAVDNQQDRWMVRRPGGKFWLANGEQVEKMVTTLAEIRKGQVRGKASTDEELASFGLAGDETLRVKVWVMEEQEPETPEGDEGESSGENETNQQEPQVEEVLAADLKVGKRGPTYSTNYIQEEGSDEVFLSYNNLNNVLNKSEIDQWRDKTICELPTGLVTGLIFQGPEESWTITRNQGGLWEGVKPEPFPVLQEPVKSLVDNIAGLKGKDFPDEDATLDELGLDDPEYTITLASPLGGFVMHVSPDMDGKTWVMRESDGYVFEVFRTNIQILKKSREDLVDKAARDAGTVPSGEGVTREEMPKPR